MATYHVVEAGRRKLGHHSLRERVVRRLEQTEDDIVRPELPDVVEPKLVGPYADHAPQRDHDRDNVGYDEHRLRRNLPVPLDVPEAERADGGRNCLRQA